MAQEQSLKELTFLSTNEEERYSRVQKERCSRVPQTL